MNCLLKAFATTIIEPFKPLRYAFFGGPVYLLFSLFSLMIVVPMGLLGVLTAAVRRKLFMDAPFVSLFNRMGRLEDAILSRSFPTRYSWDDVTNVQGVLKMILGSFLMFLWAPLSSILLTITLIFALIGDAAAEFSTVIVNTWEGFFDWAYSYDTGRF